MGSRYGIEPAYHPAHTSAPTRRLLIFNPDTDFASASGSDFYTPPKAALAQAFADPLTACRWGKPGDVVLFPYGKEPARLSGFTFLDIESLKTMSDRARDDFWNEIASIEPWGWNRALRRKLFDAGAPDRLLPSPEQLEFLRDLSHRRTTVAFNRFIAERIREVSAEEDPDELDADAIPYKDIPCLVRNEGEEFVPREFTDVEDAMRFLDANPGCWFKLPWSSSGRGVLNSAVNSRERVEEWVRGGIRRQGSVMAETGADRALDFATEWEMRDGKARFIGLSLFEVTGRGQYQGNIRRTQSEIHVIISKAIWLPLPEIIDHQKKALEKLPLKRYEGFLGIDMIAERDGSVRPCVEINLRRTMGLLNILSPKPHLD